MDFDATLSASQLGKAECALIKILLMEIQRYPRTIQRDYEQFWEKVQKNLGFCEYLSYIRIKKDQIDDSDEDSIGYSTSFLSTKQLDINNISALIGQFISLLKFSLYSAYEIAKPNLICQPSPLADDSTVIYCVCVIVQKQEGKPSTIRRFALLIFDYLFDIVKKSLQRYSKELLEFRHRYNLIQKDTNLSEKEFLAKLQSLQLARARSKLYKINLHSILNRICHDQDLCLEYVNQLVNQRVKPSNSIQIFYTIRLFLERNFPCKVQLKNEDLQHLAFKIDIEHPFKHPTAVAQIPAKYHFEIVFNNDKELIVKLRTNIQINAQNCDSFYLNLNYFKENSNQFESQSEQVQGKKYILVKRSTNMYEGEQIIQKIFELMDILMAIKIVLTVEEESFRSSIVELERIQLKLCNIPQQMIHYTKIIHALSSNLSEMCEEHIGKKVFQWSNIRLQEEGSLEENSDKRDSV